MRWRRTSPRRPYGPAAVTPDLLAWASAVDVSRLSEHTVKAAENYLRDYWRVGSLTRREFGLRLMAAVDSQLGTSPPLSATPPDILAVLLAVRREQLGTSGWPGQQEWPGTQNGQDSCG